jgi:hypothetical protein
LLLRRRQRNVATRVQAKTQTEPIPNTLRWWRRCLRRNRRHPICGGVLRRCQQHPSARRSAGHENGPTGSGFPSSCASFEARPARVEHYTSLLHLLSRHCQQRTVRTPPEIGWCLNCALALITSPQTRFQLTTDGFYPYKPAVKAFLRGRVDFAQLVKVYATSRDGEQRYSPGEVVDGILEKIVGNPDSDRICTSHIERQNLSIRMGMRRMTRLTNAFSKKWENLEAAYALWFAFYNFCRVHKTLRVTPAMESGIADRVWSLGDLLNA